MKRRLVPLVISLFLVQDLTAQSKDEKYYAFDKDWKGTAIEKAVYFLRTKKLGDKQFLWTTYQIYGPRISQEVFQDEAGQIRNGYCRYYHPNGQQDSVGTCTDNLPTGDWWYYNMNGQAIRKKNYEKGLVVKDSVIVPVNSNKQDSTQKTKEDPAEVESTFKGGIQSWARFLNKNFKYPERALGVKKEGTVVVQFIVNEEGAILDPEIITSVEYSLDEEALRIMSISPKWNPAFQFGKHVKSYKRQPVIFRLN
ncbi:MAG: energy transducer TonB [Williamsia sp.]|nr:energy transducer TonB [Williamsia sp.]